MSISETKRATTLRDGFTLLEILIFVAIFSFIIVAFMTIFVSVSGIQVRQSASAEVASQSQFLLQTIQYHVERASAIELPTDTPQTQLVLRMPSAAEDPMYIFLDEDMARLDYGTSSIRLTSNKVSLTDLSFTKRVNSPGHDSVAVSFTMEYKTENLKQRFAHAINTSISRVAAATFDSNVVPNAANTYGLGASAGDWRSINSTIYFSGSNVGIGVAAPGAKFQVTSGDVYVDTIGNGVILRSASGTCYRVTVSNAGALTTASLTCP